MSAWIVSENHINTLIEWGLRLGIIVAAEADTAGRDLWAENLASVAHRYPRDTDGTRPGPSEFRDADVTTYTFAPAKAAGDAFGAFDPNNPEHALRQVECYSYQSSERLDWESSWAKSYTDALRSALDGPATRAHRNPKRDTAEVAWGV